MMSSRRIILLLTALAAFAAMAPVSRHAAARTRTQARKQYREKLKALDEKQLDARLALAIWCVDVGLVAEARRQLDVAAFMNPRSKKLLPAWSKLAAKMPRKKVVISLVYEDGSVIKGTCAPKPFLLKHDSGVMLVPVTERVLILPLVLAILYM